MKESFESFLAKHLSKTTFEELHLFFNSSKKMVTVRLKKPQSLSAHQLCVLIELTGLKFEDFKAFIK